jgi:hypothetical protein
MRVIGILAAGLVACTTAKPPVASSDVLEIHVLQGGTQCEAEGQKFTCAELPPDVRDRLVIEHQCRFKISMRGSPPYEATEAIVRGIRSTGCKMGFVNFDAEAGAEK